jgi:WD40 repeat protein
MMQQTDAETLKARFEPHERHVVTAKPQIVAARFSPSGRQLVAGGLDARVRRWELETDTAIELTALDGHHGWVQALDFNPAGTRLFTGDSWGQLRGWAFDQLHPMPTWIQETAHEGWLRDLQVSPDGRTLATCGREQVVRLWSTDDGSLQHELRGHGQDVFCVRFHPNGQTMVSGDERGVVKQWDLATGHCLGEFDASVLYLLHRLQDVGGARVLTFDKDGKTLACAGTTPKNGGSVQGTPTILLFDVDSRELKQTLALGAPTHCFVHDVHLHDEGFVMAVTSGTPGQGQLVFQRPEDDEPFYLNTKMQNCHSLSVHPDGSQLAVVATNRGSNGNGRRLDKDGQYAGNSSPIHLLQMGVAADG